MTPGVVAETDLAGTTKSEYIFFDGERVARRDGPTGTGGVFYYFSDHLKTASVITDSAGVIKAESDYYPWGGELQFVNNDSNDYKFTGKRRDTESQLDYFGARYYSNALGRFMTPDYGGSQQPNSNPKTLNLYAYGQNNPLRFADETGFDAVDRVNRATAQLGIPYLTTYKDGSNNGGVDCSLLCQRAVGADLGAGFPRQASGQYAFAQDNKALTTDPSQVQPGDEVFFADNNTGKIVHVGIVVSAKDGNIEIVEAPGHDKNGNPKPVKRIRLGGTKAGSAWGKTEHIAGYGLWHQFDQHTATRSKGFWATVAGWFESIFSSSTKPNPEGHPKRHQTTPCLKRRDGTCV